MNKYYLDIICNKNDISEEKECFLHRTYFEDLCPKLTMDLVTLMTQPGYMNYFYKIQD